MGGDFSYYKPPTCVLQLFETPSQAGQDYLTDLVGGRFFYYKPSNCVLELFEMASHTGKDCLTDLVGGRFFYYKPSTCVLQFFDTAGHADKTICRISSAVVSFTTSRPLVYYNSSKRPATLAKTI